MIVYRISSVKYAGSIESSGIEARWNRKGQKVIYTSESRSLACLENVVHRSQRGLTGLFKTMVIEVPDDLKMEVIKPKILPEGWQHYDKCRVCQEIGSAWFTSDNTAILKVPSALVPQENNYILNTLHPDFRRIRLVDAEEFTFDSRILPI